MRPFLLDVNVVVALLWPGHVHYRPARRWFVRNREFGFRTCPITQAGSIRILTTPGFSKEVVPIAKAQQGLSDLLALPQHGFWPDDIPVNEALSGAGLLTGHRQITDAYLLALAKARSGILATFDRGVLALRGAKEHAHLIVD